MKFKKINLLMLCLFILMLFGCGKTKENNETKEKLYKEIIEKMEPGVFSKKLF